MTADHDPYPAGTLVTLRVGSIAYRMPEGTPLGATLVVKRISTRDLNSGRPVTWLEVLLPATGQEFFVRAETVDVLP